MLIAVVNYVGLVPITMQAARHRGLDQKVILNKLFLLHAFPCLISTHIITPWYVYELIYF